MPEGGQKGLGFFPYEACYPRARKGRSCVDAGHRHAQQSQPRRSARGQEKRIPGGGRGLTPSRWNFILERHACLRACLMSPSPESSKGLQTSMDELTVHGGPLGVIVGRGEMMPALLKSRANDSIFCLAHRGVTPNEAVQGLPHVWVGVLEVGAAVQALRAHGVRDLVCAGSFPRPNWRDLRPDALGLTLLARLGLRWPGDDRVLRMIEDFLFQQGFTLHPPQTFCATLWTGQGAMGQHQPCAQHHQDSQLGINLLRQLSHFDFGQGVAIQNGLVLAVEAAEGTDQCIARAGQLRHHNNEHPVYVKSAKVDQSQTMDLPAIGPGTIKSLDKAGFAGLVIASGQTLVLDPDAVVQLSNQAGLFVWAYHP
jgi:UDP-2,3-diacylglucosamine hydrolase